MSLLEQRIAQLERKLTSLARQSPACTELLMATAMVAATGGSVSHFRDTRHFASWFGLTPKEFSSGHSRKLGRISKKGDRYLRMLLTHGARAVLRDHTPFGCPQPRQEKKLTRTAFAIAV